jgi:hypothetical protein
MATGKLNNVTMPISNDPRAGPRTYRLRMGVNVGATQANDFPRQADGYEQAGGDHASPRSDTDDAERLTVPLAPRAKIPDGDHRQDPCKTAPVAVGDAEGLCGRAMGGRVRGLYLAFTTRF